MPHHRLTSLESSSSLARLQALQWLPQRASSILWCQIKTLDWLWFSGPLWYSDFSDTLKEGMSLAGGHPKKGPGSTAHRLWKDCCQDLLQSCGLRCGPCVAPELGALHPLGAPGKLMALQHHEGGARKKLRFPCWQAASPAGHRECR